MTSSATEAFGKVLTQVVRDRAIHDCDRVLGGPVQGPRADLWRSALDANCADGLMRILPDIVDETLSLLLRAIDEGEIRLVFLSEHGQQDLTDEGSGELVGSFLGDWRQKYSAERFNDYAAELELNIDW